MQNLDIATKDLDEAKDFIFQDYVTSRFGKVTLEKATKIIKEIQEKYAKEI